MWTVFIVLVFLQFIFIEARLNFEAHRLIQYDKGGKPLGSRKSTVNHVVAQGEGKHDLTRNVALVKMEQLTLELLESIRLRHAPALLVILPRDFSTISEESLEEWKEIEQNLLKGEITMAVWFTFDSPEVENIISVLERVEDKYHLSGSETARQIGRVTMTNFLGSIRGHAPTDRLKNIMLVANYDTYAAVPTLAYGANDNASGLVALLQLAAIFNRLYSQKSTHGSYNIIFLVTGAGRFNFQGTRTWLENADATTSGILENIDLVLCLDRLGIGEKLHLHLPKTKGEDYGKLIQTFEDTAKKFEIPFNLNFIKQTGFNHGGVNEWQHETFARKPIFSATLSGSGEPNVLFSESSMFDRSELIDLDILVRNIKFITEVLSRYAYGHLEESNFEVLTGEYAVNEEFVKRWIDYFGRTPRMSPYLADSGVVEMLSQVLTQYTQDVMKHEFRLDTSFNKFYSSSTVEFSAYRVKNFWFDITLSLIVCVYLFLFHIALKAPKSQKEWLDAVSLSFQ